jgi:hypothetical protein
VTLRRSVLTLLGRAGPMRDKTRKGKVGGHTEYLTAGDLDSSTHGSASVFRQIAYAPGA